MINHFAIRDFAADIAEKNYVLAARRYYNWAYMFRLEFNAILRENGVYDKVINLMWEICDPTYADQP